MICLEWFIVAWRENDAEKETVLSGKQGFLNSQMSTFNFVLFFIELLLNI